MDHSVFVEKYRSGLITVSVDKNKAGFMYESPLLMPQKLRTQQAIVRTAAFGGLLVGVALFLFAPWWFALAILLLGGFMFPKAQYLAAKGVLKAALESRLVYEVDIQNNVLDIKEDA